MTAEQVRYGSVYEEIAAKLDLGRFVPVPAAGIEWSKLVTRHGETYYVLKSAAGRYMRMDERDFFVFTRMDGKRSIKQIVLDYFHEFKTFGFERVVTVVGEMRRSLFLANSSALLYDQIARKLRPPAIQRAARWAWRTFLHKEFAIGGIDGLFGRIYERFGWIFFTRSARWLMAAVTVAGLVAFAGTFASARFSFLRTRDSYALGVLVLLAINLLVIAVHESAHALATKHYKRTVARGGVMLYFGMPAFFVDTSDMYLTRARHRIAVSWAGPAVELALGGLCSILVWLAPAAAVAPVLYKFAAFFYIGVVVNMNPLLELDGYYMLEDFLEIPNLRRRSISFLKKRLWGKLARREKLTSQERFLAVFGAFAAAYSVLVVFLALYILKNRLATTLRELAERGGLASYILIGVLIAALAVPLCFMVFMRIVSAVTAAVDYALRTRLFQSTVKVAAVLGACIAAVLAASHPANIAPGAMKLAGAGATAVAGVALAFAAKRFSGSPLRATLTLLGIAFVALPLLWAARTLHVPHAGDAVLHGFSGLLVLAWIIEFLRKKSFDRWALPSQVVCLLLAVSWAVLWGRHDQWLGGRAPAILAVSSGILFLGHAFDLFNSAFRPAVVTVGLGVTGGATAQTASMGEPALFFGLATLAGVVLFVQIFETAGVREVPDTSGRRMDDTERLRVGVEYMVEGLLGRLEAVVGRRYGWRRNLREWIAENRLPLSLHDDGLGIDGSTPLLAFASAAGRLLRRLSEVVSHALGNTFARSAIRDLFERLNWQEREVLENYCLGDVELAGDATASFREQRTSRAEILAANPIFAGLSPEEISRAAAAFTELEFADGERIVREGNPGDRFYVIASGEVEVTKLGEDGRPRLLAALGPGDYFGEIALLKDVPRTATCSARGPVRALALERAAFDRMVRDRFELLGKVETAASLTAMVRRMPLFAEFSPADQAALIRAFETRSFADGELIIRQGDRGDEFFIIESGRVEITVASDGGEEKKVAEIGQGEYFGEIALVEDRPRSASVRAMGAVSVAVLARGDFERLVKAKMSAAGRLEQTGSRRLIDTRHKTKVG